jgi:hypothetical protein
MTKRPRLTLLVLALVVVYILVGVSGTFYAYRRPLPLNAHERQLLRAPPLPYTVIVKPWDPETAAHTSQDPLAYAQGLSEALIPSGAFRTSRLENNAQATDGDLIATSTGIYCNNTSIPLFTLLSLGIIPTVFDDEDCEGLELRRPGAPASASSVRIEFHNKHRDVLGLPALFMGILPGWSYGHPLNDSRFHQRFRLEVISHQSEIERLMAEDDLN